MEIIMENTPKLYGIVEGYENISFVLDGFQCVFFNTDSKPKTFTTLLQNQGFILGRTIEQKYVYIYSNQDLKIWNKLTLNTWGYFVSSSPDVTTYKAICFEGGILNKLFFQSSLIFESTGAAETMVKYHDDSLTYPLSNKKIDGSISIYSNPHEHRSAEGGDLISTGGAHLEITFDEKKEIQVFPEIFGYILNMCQFMTFRRNIKFEKITLKDKCNQFPELMDSIADCYIHYDYAQYTEKSFNSCLTFNTLGACVTKLLDSIINNNPNKPRFNIGFIPENDKSATFVTSMTIREVCSALESEMELSKIEVQPDMAFNELVKKLKDTVIKDRDGVHSLTDTKSYDYILGTLRHLSGALSDRIEKCFFKYQFLMGEYISRNQIDQLVKYRNTITHGSFMPLDNDLAETAFVLIKLVYCCILKRIGLTDNAIKELFKWHLIS
ncbi:MAG: hypothetical protein NC313_12940 [Butyrivibrio sp.]|nr:hypothetical protein [Butyrivibrio sp.]